VDRSRSHGQDRRSEQERRQEEERRRDRQRAGEQDRRSGADRRVALDRVRDQAQVRRLENQWRALEEQHPEWTHAFRKHVDITEHGLARRAADWKLSGMPDVPRDATKWRSADAMVVAADRMRHSDQYQRRLADAQAKGIDRFPTTERLSTVLGPGWRTDVYGRTAASHGAQASQWYDDSTVRVVWQRRSDGRWHPLTCYPQPGG
jgi:hypothetical protein